MATKYRESLQKRFATKLAFTEGRETEFYAAPEDFFAVASYLARMGMDLLTDVTAVDYKEYFEMVYQLFDHCTSDHFTIKVKLDHENPAIASLTPIWCAANWLEREVYDLMGVTFTGHPNLERILLWEGFDGHPLRKDFVNDHRNRMGGTPQ